MAFPPKKASESESESESASESTESGDAGKSTGGKGKMNPLLQWAKKKKAGG